MKKLALAVLALSIMVVPVKAQNVAFEHIVVVVQENRTPDNLFYALCFTRPCSTTDGIKYDIQTDYWLDVEARIVPAPVPLANGYDLSHSHKAFEAMCNRIGDICRMDGAGAVRCLGACPPYPQFKYVDNASGLLNPYLDLVTRYGWANYMFQTNQGPSFPAHQFLFGATSAPSQTDDQNGTFAEENYSKKANGGCVSPPGTFVKLIDAYGRSRSRAYPCFEHATISDLLDQASISWRYYAVNSISHELAGDYWNAPLAIKHICVPDADSASCTGSEWANVDLNPSDVFTDVANCELRRVSWITPTGANSDHAGKSAGGPSWVAQIVNAIGESKCTDLNGLPYWDNTAIIVVWDDWGGWYDHETPTFPGFPQGAYQYGFRVPMIFVSAYTRAGYIDDNRLDFGSIARFIEGNYGISEGALGFADMRATNDLSGFYDLQAGPRPFAHLNAPKSKDWFIHDRSPQLPPDDD